MKKYTMETKVNINGKDMPINAYLIKKSMLFDEIVNKLNIDYMNEKTPTLVCSYINELIEKIDIETSKF